MSAMSNREILPQSEIPSDTLGPAGKRKPGPYPGTGPSENPVAPPHVDHQPAGPDQDQHIDTSTTPRRREGSAPQPIPAVGQADVQFVSALLWFRGDPTRVLDLVADDDLDPHLAQVLACIRTMLATGKTVDPVVVEDQLRQSGVHRLVLDKLVSAVLAKAEPLALRDYAAALVAQAFRRQIESAGLALQTAGHMSEGDLSTLVEIVAQEASKTAARLSQLRGGVS